jgi:hypothetical protein
VPGNEKADEWAKLAAEETDSHSVEFLRFGNRYYRRRLPPRSRANLKRSITETNWKEAADRKVTHKKYAPEARLRPSQSGQEARLEVLHTC